MRRVSKHKKVTLYDGISEFRMEVRNYDGYVIYFKAYNILEPDSWRNKRQSFSIFSIGNEGLYINLNSYRAHSLGIEVDDHSRIYCEGVDFT